MAFTNSEFLDRGGKRVTDKQIQENKFYVGSKTIFDRNWGHKTVEEAIEHASDIAEEKETDQFIVQIVKVVQYPRVNVIVKDVE